jgi:hypothetical protein
MGEGSGYVVFAVSSSLLGAVDAALEFGQPIGIPLWWQG